MVRILTDSAADLTQDFIDSNGIGVVPLSIIFGEEVFEDGINISKEEFYNKLLTSEYHPSTSHPMPIKYEHYFREALISGEEVIHLAISSKISGCFGSSTMAANNINDPRLFVYDTKSVSLGTGLLVMKAVELAKRGLGAKEIIDNLDEMQPDIISYIAVGKVKYLHKSGRMTMSKKILVDILDIKPILSVRNTGIVEVIGGIRGEKKALKHIVEKVAAVCTDFRDTTLAIVYTGDIKLAGELRALLTEKAQIGQVVIAEGSPVIGAHVGPGCAGFFFIKP